jgi:hypothetical protein
MSTIEQSGTFTLGDRTVKRLGYGAMQLAGPGVFGPPRDRDAALAVLREAVASGVNHIDTSDFYGPHVTNQIIREALHPIRVAPFRPEVPAFLGLLVRLSILAVSGAMDRECPGEEFV